MGLGDLLKKPALNGLKDSVINPHIKGLGTVHSLDIQDGKLMLSATLDGFDDTLISITCNKFQIASDGSSVTLGDFTASKPFAENALNRFAAKTFEVPDNKVVRMALATACKFI